MIELANQIIEDFISQKVPQGTSLIFIGSQSDYFLKNKLNNCKCSIWIYADLLSDLDSIFKFTNGRLYEKRGEEASLSLPSSSLSSSTDAKLILVVKDIDIYATKHHQQVLYTLLEMTLSRPLLLIGISRRIDILELLEKRVKSRFSQIIVYMGVPDSFEDFYKSLVERTSLWNSQVAKLIDKTLLKTYHHSFNNMDFLLSKFYLLCCSQKPSSPITQEMVNQVIETKEELVEHYLDELSYPSLLILISMKRLREGGKSFITFEAIWQEYNYIINILNLVEMQHRYGRISMRMAFEDLLNRGILKTDKEDSQNQGEFGVKSNVLLSLLPDYLRDNQKLDLNLKRLIRESA